MIALIKYAGMFWVLCVSFKQQIYFTQLDPRAVCVSMRESERERERESERERERDGERALVTGFVIVRIWW